MRQALLSPARLLLSMFLAFALAGGCASDPSEGYSFSSTYPRGIQTISIPVFDNYTFSPGLEVQVTEALIKEVQRSSGIRVSTGPADSLMTGVVTATQLRPLTVQPGTGLVQEVAVQITVDFDWKDNRTGKTIVSRRSFSASDTFVPAKPTGERLEVGQHAAVQRLARDIVAEMRTSW